MDSPCRTRGSFNSSNVVGPIAADIGSAISMHPSVSFRQSDMLPRDFSKVTYGLVT
jgi:hypothetical protein